MFVTCVYISRVLTSYLSQDFQFFPPQLAVLQERELAVHKVLRRLGFTQSCLI